MLAIFFLAIELLVLVFDWLILAKLELEVGLIGSIQLGDSLMYGAALFLGAGKLTGRWLC